MIKYMHVNIIEALIRNSFSAEHVRYNLSKKRKKHEIK